MTSDELEAKIRADYWRTHAEMLNRIGLKCPSPSPHPLAEMVSPSKLVH